MIGAALLAALAYVLCGAGSIAVGARVCRAIVPFDDGPGASRPPSAALVAGSGVLGFALALHDSTLPALALGALLSGALVGCWYCDVRCGIVPDVFTLAPLAIVLAVALGDRDVRPLVSAALVFVPFAGAAVWSRGLGMGWGDVKLAALGAAALGATTSLVAFASACLLAVVIALARGRRSAPIAFAPYLAGSIALALALPAPWA